MKRTIVIDAEENRVELLKEGYNIVETTIYDEEIVKELKEVLNKIVFGREVI